MKRIWMPILAIFCLVPFLSCDWSEDKESSRYKFAIVAYGAGGFEGYYRVDGGEIVFFTQTVPAVTGGSYYTLEQNLDSPETLFVSVNAIASTCTSIDIQIFKESDMVKENVVSQNTVDVIISNSVSYDFTTASDTTTTTSSSVNASASE